MSTSSPIAGPPLTSSPNTQIILSDLDLNSLPQDMKKENKDWHCVFNPNLKRKALDIDLKWNFHHPSCVSSLFFQVAECLYLILIPLLFSVVCCVQFSADGKWLATGCNKTAQIYDVSTGNKVWCVYEPHLSSFHPRGIIFKEIGAKLGAIVSVKNLDPFRQLSYGLGRIHL
jgi:WD40 repeat protein